MEDYDPTNFRRRKGDILVAWLLCAILMISILVAPLIDGTTGQDRKDDTGAAVDLGGSMQRGTPSQDQFGLDKR